MNGQRNGSPKGMLGKKMFSLIAVALMVASCLAVVAAVDDSNADTTDATEIEQAISITKTDSGWDYDLHGVPGIEFDEASVTLTLNNVNVIVKNSHAINIGEGAKTSNTVFTIKLIGNNYVTCVPQVEGELCCLGVQVDELIIKGDDHSSSSLTLTTDSSKVANLDSQGILSMANNTLIEGVSLTIKHNGGCDEYTGINASTTSIVDSILTVESVSNYNSYIGANFIGDITLTNSNVVINPNDIGSTNKDSIGVQDTIGAEITIEDSFFVSSAHLHAVCYFSVDESMIVSYTPWDNGFIDTGIWGDMTKYVDPEYKPITADTIDVNYKSVIIGSAGHTLSFDKDGGDGRAPDSVRLASGETYTIPACKLTKDGCDADGWVDSNGKVYHAGDKFTMGDSDVVLKPHWNNGIGISMTILAIIMFFSILLIIGIVFAVRKYEE